MNEAFYPANIPEFNITQVEWSGSNQRLWLANGWGVSVAQGPYNYCSYPDTAELAVIHRDDSPQGWDIRYDSGFANDVIGWQTPADLVDLLVKLNTLPAEFSNPEDAPEFNEIKGPLYDDCGCIIPCPDHSPAVVGQEDRNYWTSKEYDSEDDE